MEKNFEKVEKRCLDVLSTLTLLVIDDIELQGIETDSIWKKNIYQYSRILQNSRLMQGKTMISTSTLIRNYMIWGV